MVYQDFYKSINRYSLRIIEIINNEVYSMICGQL